jgi:hypothetical protein
MRTQMGGCPVGSATWAGERFALTARQNTRLGATMPQPFSLCNSRPRTLLVSPSSGIIGPWLLHQSQSRLVGTFRPAAGGRMQPFRQRRREEPRDA